MHVYVRTHVCICCGVCVCVCVCVCVTTERPCDSSRLGDTLTAYLSALILLIAQPAADRRSVRDLCDRR